MQRLQRFLTHGPRNSGGIQRTVTASSTIQYNQRSIELTPRSRRLLKKSNFQHFMETGGSLPYSQPVTGPYPVPHAPRPQLPNFVFLRSILILSSHLRPSFLSGLLSSSSSTKNFHLLSLPWVLHAPSISSLIWSPPTNVAGGTGTVQSVQWQGYGLDASDSIFDRGREFFTSLSCPDRLWGPTNLLSNGYWASFPRE
jgi:hypothetical protein